MKKRQKDISSIEDKIISMYAKGMTTRQISEQVEDIYGFEVSEGLVSNITDKLLPKIEEWKQRPLSSVYPIVFVDAVHFSVRDNGIIKKKAVYVILGINEEEKKDVLSIEIGENESSKYWLGVFNSLKNRGVKDILILYTDGLLGMKESIAIAFPKTEYQRCIGHHLMKSWSKNWAIFKFSMEVRKVVYTTNAIESLNSIYRHLNNQRSVFPSDTSLLKALYLATFEAIKKWTANLRNWGKIYGELQIMYEDRFLGEEN